jgi:hypothetical protein
MAQFMNFWMNIQVFLQNLCVKSQFVLQPYQHRWMNIQSVLQSYQIPV